MLTIGTTCLNTKNFVFFSQSVFIGFVRLIEQKVGARGSVVVKAQSYKPEGRGITSRWGGFFLIHLILLAALGPGVDSASNRNEYQES
jgi:hypothetical protein